MKKLLYILLATIAMSCGNGSDNRSDREAGTTEEGLDEGAGKEISPQLETDSSESRFEVDTISSSTEAQQKQKAGDTEQ